MPLNHVSLRVTDLERSRAFYLTTLQPLGYRVFKAFPNVVGLAACVPDLWLVTAGHDEGWSQGKHSGITPQHICFDAGSRAEVRRFYEAAIRAGGKDNGKPGLRPQYVNGYYATFILDPDGHNIEACCFSPWWMYLKYFKLPMSIAALGAAYWVGKEGLL